MAAAASSSSPAATWIGDRFLRISFGDAINMQVQEQVWIAMDVLAQAQLPEIEDLTAAFTTLLVTLTHPPDSYDIAKARILEIFHKPSRASKSPERLIEIPVCYEPQFAPDLADLAEFHNLTPQQVIDLHSSSTYSVAFIGFTPGFPYLLGLPDNLATPRLASPRVRVPAGSIGIAGHQTGIYPWATPGGWRLLGRTPLRMFTPNSPFPSRLQMRDQVKFNPISAAEFEAIVNNPEAH